VFGVNIHLLYVPIVHVTMTYITVLLLLLCRHDRCLCHVTKASRATIQCNVRKGLTCLFVIVSLAVIVVQDHHHHHYRDGDRLSLLLVFIK
jgi:hypothetical protein